MRRIYHQIPEVVGLCCGQRAIQAAFLVLPQRARAGKLRQLRGWGHLDHGVSRALFREPSLESAARAQYLVILSLRWKTDRPFADYLQASRVTPCVTGLRCA